MKSLISRLKSYKTINWYDTEMVENLLGVLTHPDSFQLNRENSVIYWKWKGIYPSKLQSILDWAHGSVCAQVNWTDHDDLHQYQKAMKRLKRILKPYSRLLADEGWLDRNWK